MAYARKGFRGSTPPPIEDFKRNKNLSFLKRTAFFHTEIAEIALMFFCAIQLAHKILKNVHCDAIIGLVIAKLCLCAALDVDDCRKSETFLVFKAKSFLRTITVSGAI